MTKYEHNSTTNSANSVFSTTRHLVVSDKNTYEAADLQSSTTENKTLEDYTSGNIMPNYTASNILHDGGFILDGRIDCLEENKIDFFDDEAMKAGQLPASKEIAPLSIDSSLIKEELKKLYSFEDRGAIYLKKFAGWDQLKRSNAPENSTKKTGVLSEAAKGILSLVIQRLKKEGIVILNHRYLSKITKCDRRQNQRIIHQLHNIFDISYHNSITYEGKKHRYSYAFCLKTALPENIESENESIERKNEAIETKASSVRTELSQQSTYIYKDYNNKVRSMHGSNFENSEESNSAFKTNSLDELTEEKPTAQTGSTSSPNKATSRQEAYGWDFRRYKTPRHLKDFYPLSQEDCDYFQANSGKGFDLNAMNEILLDLIRKGVKPFFHFKKGFMGYMTEVYRKEMRDAEKINNVNFKISANQTPEEKQAEKIEKYLSEIENSRQVSPEWHLKKKFTSVLAPAKAYDLLQAYRSIDVRRGIASLTLLQPVELTDHDIGIILSQIKATHETFERGQYHHIDKVEFIVLEPKPRTSSTGNAKNQAPQLPDNIWGTMRRHLKNIYPEGIDKHWFAKLDATIDESKKMIVLKAPNSLFESWIRSNYSGRMEHIAAEMGVSFSIGL